MECIQVKNLVKEYKYSDSKNKLWTKLLFKGNKVKCAVNDISFTIKKGEVVGYIGPNGAGKSTTLKILTGIMVPTSGTITVNDIIPYKKRKQFVKNIGVVFGQRTQLWWDLPLIDSFKLLKSIYKIPNKIFENNLKFYVGLLKMDDFMNQPVRRLSLGQRMKADIVASLIHDPEILFLDEPTIGLDIISKENIINFLKELNVKKGITIILTSHNLEDIELLCKRLIMIDKGKKIFDGNLRELKKSLPDNKILKIELANDEKIRLTDLNVNVVEKGDRSYWIYYNPNNINSSDLINLVSTNNNIKDLTLEEIDINTVVKHFLQQS
ncbi:MAG: ATP-binding cassette domain-containing protein [Halanaerobiales bacterium]|nr:ATP-binding cassette domain-containing protein [Halanaerobiales bacterium]